MDLDMKQLALAIRTIAEEKNLPEDTVKDAVEQALAAAYRRDYGDRDQEIKISMNLNTGDVDAYVQKIVVENVENSAYEITLGKAQVMNKSAQIGDSIEVHQKVESFGRVAAQTAKQVILQKLREAEREVVLAEYEDKIGSILNSAVSRVEGSLVRVEIGKASGIMPRQEQIQGERYYPGQRLKIYLKEIEKGFKGPQLIASRACIEFIEALFRSEVPEMESNAVEIKGISREAGVRTKIAVKSNVKGVDPVGTFVGGHGTRVNAVMSEIGEQEKIDIIVWDEDVKQYIINALSPTKIDKVEISEEEKRANVIVPEDQLSIAIGKGGQNVRLASKLTGYEIDIVSNGTPSEVKVEEPAEVKVEAKPVGKLKRKSELENSLLDAIEEHGE